MGTVIFLGIRRSGSTRDAVTAAFQLGLHTVVLTDRKSLIRDQAAFPDVHRMIYVESWRYEDVLQMIESLKLGGLWIEGIISLIDPHVSLAASLADAFGVNYQSLHAIATMEDKIQTRTALNNTPYNPEYTICYPDDSTQAIVRRMSRYLPVVIKAPDLTGSKDVRRAFKLDQLKWRLTSIRNRFPSKKLLIEQYLQGPQYLVEVLVNDGVITPVAIVRQHVLYRDGFMIVDGYAVLIEPEADLIRGLLEAVEAIVKELGMKTGACHLELRKSFDGDWKLIEINPRISGGAMNRMVEVAYGINYAREIVKMMIGHKPDLTPRFKRHVYTKFVTSPESGLLKKVKGRNRANRVPGVEEVFIICKQGQRIHRPVSMAHRYAYAIAADNHALDTAEIAACSAAEQIQFVLESTARHRTHH